MSPKLLNILLVIAPVVLYMVLIKPLVTGTGTLWVPEMSIKDLQRVNAEYSAALSNTTLIENGIESIHKDYLKIDANILNKNAQMFPDQIDEARLRNEIVTIATKQGIAIDALDVVKDKRGTKTADFYTITFNIRSRYPAFKKLLEEYEKSTRFYHIESLSISRQKDVDEATTSLSDKDILSIQIKFRVHQAR